MKANEVKSIAAELQSEAKDRAHRIAVDLFGAVPVDGQRLSKAAFLDMVRRNWNDPNYRQALLTRIGEEAFLNAASEAGCIPTSWPEVATQMEATNVAGI